MSRHDFDFLNGTWHIDNRRRDADGGWQEFPATGAVAMHVEGLVQFDRYVAPAFPGRGHVEAVTVRAYDEASGEWSIVWLSNYAPPDLRPVVGAWDGDKGVFAQTIEDEHGQPLGLRFDWERMGADRAHWGQSFSRDGGATWELDWTMDFTRTA
jgi:hypothetical protein